MQGYATHPAGGLITDDSLFEAWLDSEEEPAALADPKPLTVFGVHCQWRGRSWRGHRGTAVVQVAHEGCWLVCLHVGGRLLSGVGDTLREAESRVAEALEVAAGHVSADLPEVA